MNLFHAIMNLYRQMPYRPWEKVGHIWDYLMYNQVAAGNQPLVSNTGSGCSKI